MMRWSLTPWCFQRNMGLPVFFQDILVELVRHQRQLGGKVHFPDYPTLQHKVKREEFSGGYSDYEYVYLTVLGFAQLHIHLEEIVAKNNSKSHEHNPGVQLLERLCGMTMHADREGAGAILRAAPQSLVQAFAVARDQKCMLEFFRSAFDRSADPCLEGRTSRLWEFVEEHQPDDFSEKVPPWEDVSLRPLPSSCGSKDIVGEHLRVFLGECTWHWAQKHGITYAAAKKVRDAHDSDFSSLYNSRSFESAVRQRGTVQETPGLWEVSLDRGDWSPFDADVSEKLEAAWRQGQWKVELQMGPKNWRYSFDLRACVQLNPKTQKSRRMRRVECSGGSHSTRARPGTVTAEELRLAIRHFVDLDTLPES